MANIRELDKRRKSIKNIRKITRTMELIATARFKQAMDRAASASAYTQRITQLVADLAAAGLDVSHPLLEDRPETKRSTLLVLTGNRGLCGGYNSNILRKAVSHHKEVTEQVDNLTLEVSGRRGVSGMNFREIPVDESYTHFEDKPSFDEVDVLAKRYLDEFATGKLDRLDVVYTRFISVARQEAIVETLLPLGSLAGSDESSEENTAGGDSMYEFLPSAGSILEEVVPTSFKIKLFKCFLDAAVGEQVARMVAMKSATENADDMIRDLSRTFNRARQSQITSEILEVVGGAEALSG